MGLFGGLGGKKSRSSSSTTVTPYSDTAAKTIKALEQQGLDLTALLNPASVAQQDFEKQAYGQAGANLAGQAGLTDALYTEAMNQESPLDAANKAETSVLSEIAQANDALKRDMGRFGLNPNAMMSNSRNMGIEGAKAIVGARSMAEEAAKDKNYQKILSAIDSSNSVLNQLTNYDATGSLANAIGTTADVARVGLTPKDTKSKGKSTAISWQAGVSGYTPGGTSMWGG